MSRPIVVLMPGKGRAALRDGGALPPSFFDRERGVLLWPHDMDYETGLRVASMVESRPGDVPAFFGFPPSGTAAEIGERTAEIVSVLNATMVHVVFLGNESEDSGVEYGRFRSFRSLIDWSRALAKVLRTRFVNEIDLHNVDSVLVVVCNGLQMKVTDEDCRDFEALVGENPNDAPPESLHPFTSCYFMNHELSIDGGPNDFLASSVWDLALGRLLKAFVLSRELAPDCPMWKRPGVRIWRAEECMWGAAEGVVRKTSESVLAKIRKELEDSAVGPKDKSSLSEPFASPPVEDVETDPMLDYDKSWSVFDPVALAAEAERSGARAAKVEASADSFFAWRRANELRCDDAEVRRVFSSVKDDPRQLFARSREIDSALGARAASNNGSERFAALVNDMANTESRRRGLVAALADMAGKMRLTQSHYVGSGTALFVVAAVTAMCGVALWQVVTLLGGSLSTVLWLIATSAAGALAAAAAIVATHYHAGSEAAEAYAETCRDLDRTSVQRYNEERNILCEAVMRRLETRRRNARLVTSDLLARIRGVLLCELGYDAARVRAAQSVAAKREATLSVFARGQRKDYLAATVGDIGGTASAMQGRDVEAALVAAWGADGGEMSFPAFWSGFCNEFDKAGAGHLPVSEFIPRMRKFMSSFVCNARRKVRKAMDEACSTEKAKAAKKWVEATRATGYYSAKAAVNTRAKSGKRQVFVARDENRNFFGTVSTASDLTVSTEFFESELLSEASGAPLVFAVHEVAVRLGRDASGVLSISQGDWGGES